MRTFQTLEAVIDHFVLTLTFKRSDVHNAFNPLMMAEIVEALTAAKEDARVRVVVLRAEGKSFSAGADLKWMKESAAFSKEKNIADATHLSTLMETLYTFPKPTIACVQGATYGGGVGLVACADIVLAKPTAVFCLSEVKLGLIPAVIAPYVTEAIGPRMMRRYMQTAEVIPAHKALQMGLAHEICEGEFEEKLIPLIDHLVAAGPKALGHCKMLMRALDAPLRDVSTMTVEVIATLRQSSEAQEGLSAFFEKRPPAWTQGNS